MASLAAPQASPSQQGEAASAAPERLTEEAARALSSPIPYGEASIERGKLLYRFHGCAECHGHDGRALIEIVADATDLTDPDLWREGTEEGSIFRSLRDGVGVGMPGYAAEVEDETDLWDLVNYVRSLWPKERRPRIASGPP